MDLCTWPPLYEIVPEYTLAIARSAEGKWLSVAADGEHNHGYLARVRGAQFSDTPRIIRPHQPQSRSGLEGGGFIGERVVAFAWFEKGVSPQRVPLIEQNGALINARGVNPLPDNHLDHWGGVDAHGCVVRLRNGCDLVLWHGVGYEFASKFVLRLAVPEIGTIRSSPPSALAWQDQGFIFVGSPPGTNRQLMMARVGHRAVPVAPKIENPMQIAPGPDKTSLLVKQGTNKKRWVGAIWFPDEDSVIPLDKNVIRDEDPQAVNGLFFSQATGRLIAATPERLWSTAIKPLLDRPKFGATNGRAVK